MSTLSVATLAEVRTLARQYANMENSQFVTDAEFNSYINLAYFELYDILIQAYGEDYFVKPPFNFNTDGVSQLYSLPADFYKFLGLDLQLGTVQGGGANQSWITIRPFMFGDRNRFAVPNFQSFYGVTNVRYRIFSNAGPTNSSTNTGQIFLTPTPAQNQTFRIWYIPRLTELSADTDTLDGISGWQEYVVVDTAIRALIKEESDPSAFMARKAALIDRINSASTGRDAGNPQTVTDTQYSEFWYPMGTQGQP